MTLNWLAVLLAFVAFFAIGAIWFGPKTFYPVWVKALGSDPQKSPNAHGMAVVFGLTALGALAQVLAVAVVIDLSGATGPLSGAGIGLLLGVGIAAASSLSHRLFGGQGLRVWIIEVSGDIVSLTVAGLIIGLLG